MNLRLHLEQRLRALAAHPRACIYHHRCGAPLDEDEIEAVTELTGVPPSPVLVNLLGSMSGAELTWSLPQENAPDITGSLNILPLRSALLGWSATPEGEPFEGVIWSPHFSPKAVASIKPLRVFELVTGEPAAIAFESANPKRAYFVEEETVRKMPPGLVNVAHFLVQYLGCQGLREALTQANWRQALLGVRGVAVLGRI